MQFFSLANRWRRWRQQKLSSDAFWTVAEGHIGFIYNVALNYTGNRFDAEDLVQEALAIAYNKFGQLRDGDRFRGWVFTIMRNVYLRNRRRNQPIMMEDFENSLDYLDQIEAGTGRPDTAQVYEKKVEAELVQTLLRRLPEKYQTVLILYYMQDQSYRDIARTLALPIGTVMSRLSRAKQAMKKALLRHRLLAPASRTEQPLRTAR